MNITPPTYRLLVGALSLAVSLIYDWGFYGAYGLPFSAVPSALSDHVRSAVVWLPKIISAFIPYFVFEVLTRRIEQGMTEEEIIKSSPNPEWTRRFRAGPQKAFLYISLIAALGYILLGEAVFGSVTLPAIVLWMSFAEWAQSHPLIERRRPFHLRMAIILLPTIGIMIYSFGRADAIEIYKAKPLTKVIFSGRSTATEASIVRYLDKGILLKTADEKITFIQWSAIERIDTHAAYKSRDGIICSWFGIGCLNKNGKPKMVQQNQSSPSLPSTSKSGL
jgi:hypothetical protein